MKLKILTATATALLATSLTCNAARADDCNRAISFIRSPQGACLDLSYMPLLSQSRRDLNAASQLYNAALDLNTQPAVTTFIQTSGRNSTITTYRNDLTADEREARKQFLQDASANLREAARTHDDFERLAFQRYLRATNRLSGAFQFSR